MRTEEWGALIDTESAARITFDINPESFNDNKATEFSDIAIPGMSHPRTQFINGGARVLSFTLFLHYGVTENVPAAIKLLQSWLYPVYENGRLKQAPSRLLLLFGDTWPDELWVMQSCNVVLDRFDRELNCIFAEVAIELKEYIDKSRDAYEVRS